MEAFSIDYTNLEFENLCSSCGRNQALDKHTILSARALQELIICVLHAVHCLPRSTQLNLRPPSVRLQQDGRLTFADVQQAQHQVSKRVEDLS